MTTIEYVGDDPVIAEGMRQHRANVAIDAFVACCAMDMSQFCKGLDNIQDQIDKQIQSMRALKRRFRWRKL